MAEAHKKTETQKKIETIEDRLKTAQQYLITKLQKAGYTVYDSQILMQLARSMVGVGKEKPKSPDLDSITHRNINLHDLNLSRDILVAVAKDPAKLPVLIEGGDITAPIDKPRPGSLFNKPMPSQLLSFYGPERAVSLPEMKPPTKLKPYVYDVLAGGRKFRVEATTLFPGAGGMTSNLEATRVGQLKQALVYDSKAVLAITEVTDGPAKIVPKDEFTSIFTKAYSNALASGNYDEISVSRPLSRRT